MLLVLQLSIMSAKQPMKANPDAIDPPSSVEVNNDASSSSTDGETKKRSPLKMAVGKPKREASPVRGETLKK